jgi:hypothetical protein
MQSNGFPKWAWERELQTIDFLANKEIIPGRQVAPIGARQNPMRTRMETFSLLFWGLEEHCEWYQRNQHQPISILQSRLYSMTRRLSHVKTINLEFHFNGCCEMMFVEVRNYGFVNFICFFVSGAQQFSCLVKKRQISLKELKKQPHRKTYITWVSDFCAV